MRHLTFYLTLFALLLAAATSANAQSDPPPPPPPSPDYSPRSWKEYVYEQDNIKFRFPAEPKVTTTRTDRPSGTVTNRSYRRDSFLVLELLVGEFPAGVDFEKGPVRELLNQMRDVGLKGVREANPKIIKESDVEVDGHPAKFLHVETGDGKTIRAKYFVVKNRMYFCYVEVRKGERHGHNFENDFEAVAMGFLDSIGLAAPVK